MALLSKLAIAAAISAAALLAVETVGQASAQAALFKFSFEGEGANGYFIYDTSTPPDPFYIPIPNTEVYRGAVTEYKIDLGEKGVFQGRTGDTIVFFPRAESGIIGPEIDVLQLEVRGPDREPPSQFTLLNIFDYPKDSFGGSSALPTSVPSTATLNTYPYVAFPTTLGELAFKGTVDTRIEKVSELVSCFAFFAGIAWLILGHR